jgi:hypothetical protein
MEDIPDSLAQFVRGCISNVRAMHDAMHSASLLGSRR